MPFCPHCGHENADPEARFCSRCGDAMRGAAREAASPDEPPATLGPGATPARSPAQRRKRILWIILLADIPIIVAVVFFFGFHSKGCGHTEGAFVSQGQPLGDFTFTPTRCRSGQHMNFHGAVLVGDGPTEGGILVGEDVVKGKFVKVEIPGSCQPPDHEVCTERFVEREHCTIFEASAHKTNTTVNDIRLVDGHLKLACQFPEGGTVKADIKFENCD
jgi:hypothetical protein